MTNTTLPDLGSIEYADSLARGRFIQNLEALGIKMGAHIFRLVHEMDLGHVNLCNEWSTLALRAANDEKVEEDEVETLVKRIKNRTAPALNHGATHKNVYKDPETETRWKIPQTKYADLAPIMPRFIRRKIAQRARELLGQVNFNELSDQQAEVLGARFGLLTWTYPEPAPISWK